MILLRRIIPFAATVFMAACYVGLLLVIEEWRVWVGLIAASVIFSVLLMVKWKWNSADFWVTLYPALIWVGGGTGLLFFVDVVLYQWALVALITIVFGIYIENVFTFYYQPQKYTNLSLPNLSFYMMVLSTFFLFVFGFNLELINLLPFWILPIAVFIHSMTLMLLLMRGYNVAIREQLFAVFFFSIIITQGVWILQYWPTTAFVNGMIVLIMVYYLPSLLLMKARDAVQQRAVIQYSIISIILFLLTVLTSQWI